MSTVPTVQQIQFYFLCTHTHTHTHPPKTKNKNNGARDIYLSSSTTIMLYLALESQPTRWDLEALSRHSHRSLYMCIQSPHAASTEFGKASQAPPIERSAHPRRVLAYITLCNGNCFGMYYMSRVFFDSRLDARLLTDWYWHEFYFIYALLCFALLPTTFFVDMNIITVRS